MNKFAILLASVSPIYSILLVVENKKIRDERKQLYKALENRNQQIAYLADVLNRNDVEADEFDLIVLNDMINVVHEESA